MTKSVSDAIRMVEQILYSRPDSGFHWGSRVYEPEPSDRSAAAALKRELIVEAQNVVRRAKGFVTTGKLQSRLTFDTGVYEKLDGVLEADVEQREFTELAEYTENLVAVVNSKLGVRPTQ